MPNHSALAAVMFVELADFPDILASSERDALSLLGDYRGLADPIVADHSGEIVDATNSELLVVFSSAVAAVQCALLLSLSLAPLSAEARAGAKAKARVGLHLGEIWRDSGRVYGNGVNVAARVMQAAPAGAVYLSEDVFRQVSGKLDLSSRPVGAVSMKNIDRPIALYELEAGRGFVDGAPGAAPRDESEASPSGKPGPGAEGGDGSTDAAAAAIADGIASLKNLKNLSSIKALKGLKGLQALEKLEVLDRLDKEGELDDLGETIARKVEAAISDGNLDVSFELGSGKTVKATRRPPADPEAAADKARARIGAGVRKMLVSAGLGAALGYGYATTGQWLFLAGAAAVGLFPFISGAQRLVSASSELRLIEKRRKRGA
ncbi:MAG: adenylate/guanylate cyclase domain-containing protein [Spirochaetaceae bacterium]|nr:adenylate/guanylate cyclase domain-containing protein [Spirochaetaceae bacterium]